MQYTPGTSFKVIQSALSKTVLPFKLLFKEGTYKIHIIKPCENKISYTFIVNNSEKQTILFNSCSDVDKIIAFCRKENFIEPEESLKEYDQF